MKRKREIPSEEVDLGLGSLLDATRKPALPSGGEALHAEAPGGRTSKVHEESGVIHQVQAEEVRLFEIFREAQPSQSEAPSDAQSINKTLPRGSKYGILAEAGYWEDLSLVCERELAAADSSEPRLWWILSQFHLESVPLGVLAAPLELCTAPMVFGDSPELHSLAAEVLRNVGDALQERGEERTGRDFLERANILSPLAEGRGSKGVNPELPPFELGPLPLPSVRSDRVKRSVWRATFRDVRAVMGAGVCLGLLLSGWWWQHWKSTPGNAGTIVVRATGNDYEAPVLVLPTAQVSSKVSHLEALYYDVNRTTPAPDRAPALVVDRPVHPVAQVQPVRQERENVDVTGPIENQDIRDAIRRYHSKKERESAVDDAAWSALDDTDRARSDDRRNRDLPRGDEFDSDDSGINGEDFDLDESRGYQGAGRNTTGYRDRGDRYEVLLNTSVMERPSFNGREVASLSSGDVVIVEARVGRWLRIVSEKGRPGYIVGQDAQRITGD